MRNTSLRHLDLGANPLGAHGIYALASMLARNRTLQSLDLRGTDLCYVLEGPQSVLQSALPSSDNETNSTAPASSSSSSTTPPPFPPAAAVAGRSASPSSPTTNTISPPAPAAAISTPEHYSPPKKQRNSFGVLKLCEELGKPGCQLKHLLLSFNLFDDYSLRHLCQAIQQSQVEVLDLVNCGITQKGMEDVAKMISTAKSLSEVDISLNTITMKSARLIAQSLRKHKTLTKLGLIQCRLSEGISPILAALPHNNSLRTILLGGNLLQKQHYADLADKLKKNTSIENLGQLVCRCSRCACKTLQHKYRWHLPAVVASTAVDKVPGSRRRMMMMRRRRSSSSGGGSTLTSTTTTTTTIATVMAATGAIEAVKELCILQGRPKSGSISAKSARCLKSVC
mmetsp:Transcript_26429/g.44283  ORF Transcript_26429/g.44283 Transcript_26429/m.44283 type:complete len:397 (-) Transcript_26429:113-1303(-)